VDWYLRVLTKYAEFDGRARRKEYWMFFLVNLIISVLIGFATGFIGGMLGLPNTLVTMIALVYSLAVLLPGLAVGVRRLHDTGRSGWWLLIALIPILGALILLFFSVQDSEPGSNSYGPNPKASFA
jgi:uncharacterized membrane protein YhaH (DUF805 family)